MTKNSRINRLYIQAFRGLHDLRLEQLSDVNLILGTSNIGKTSLLEAICMLRSEDPQNIIRTLYGRFTDYPSFETVRYLFPLNETGFALSADTSEGEVNVSCAYEIGQVPLRQDFLTASDGVRFFEEPDTRKTKKTMIRVIDVRLNYNGSTQSLRWAERGNRFDRKKDEDNVVIYYLSPFDHFESFDDYVSYLLESKEQKELFLHILQLFDSRIEDALYLKNKEDSLFKSQDFSLYIRLNDGTQMPASVYGDGLKKVSLLSSALVRASNGILLIDEIETSLHHSYYDEIFSFLVRAAKHFNVQLFITSHNEEAIRKFLEAEVTYGGGSASVITLKKDAQGNTLSRCLKGRDAFERMEKEGLEVRD